MFKFLENILEEQTDNGFDFGRRIYSKAWIRPFESIWSIIQNIKLVNTICDKDLASTLSWNANVKEHYVQDLATYSQTHVNTKKIIEILHIPENQFHPMDQIVISNNQNDIIRNNVRICPVCMKKYGYHSYYHQLSWIDKCPWHDCKLEDTEVFYGIMNKSDYCFGLKANQLPAEVPLPCMRENILLNEIDLNLHTIKQVIVLKDQYSEMKLVSDWRNSNSRKRIYQAGESIKNLYLNILVSETNSNPNKDVILAQIIKKSKDGLLDKQNVSYVYDSNYFTFSYLQRLLLQYKDKRTISDIQLEDIFEFYEEEATDAYHALLMFAINLTKSSNVADAFRSAYYLHPNSCDYSKNLAYSKYIRQSYCLFNNSLNSHSDIDNFYDSNCC